MITLREGSGDDRTPIGGCATCTEFRTNGIDVTSAVILVFDDVDLLDVGGPYEVFLTADRVARRRGDAYRFDVTLAGPSTGPITAFGGMVVTPTVAAGDLTDIDIAVIPGAIAIDSILETSATAEQSSSPIVEAARHLTQVARTKSSVCTGAFLLGDLGLLDDKPWTTHFEDVDALAKRIGSDAGMPWVRWVDAGDIVTSGGLSSGIAMALHLVERHADRDLAMATARQIEYEWDPEGGVVA